MLVENIKCHVMKAHSTMWIIVRRGVIILKVINKIVAILETLGHNESLGTAELSKILGMPAATVHRILSELNKHGLIEKDENSKKYRLGWKIMNLSYKALKCEQQQFHVQLILPYLKMLSQETKETVFLAVTMQNKVVCIEKVDGQRNLRFYVEIGREMPLNCSAAAKAILAYKSNAFREEVIGSNGFILYTQHSIDNMQEYEAQLNEVRNNGYAICDNEIEIGSKAVAVPIFDSEGQVLSSISLIGPNQRVSEQFANILALMKGAAEDITMKLKHGQIV